MSFRIINGVFGLAIRSDLKVLLSQRNDPTNPATHLKWQIPGGGQEYGESLLQTLKRELREELGLQHVTLLSKDPIIHFSLWEDEEPKTQVNMFIYSIDIQSQTPSITDDESVAWNWFSLEEVIALDALPNTGEIVTSALSTYTATINR